MSVNDYCELPEMGFQIQNFRILCNGRSVYPLYSLDLKIMSVMFVKQCNYVTIVKRINTISERLKLWSPASSLIRRYVPLKDTPGKNTEQFIII